VNAISFGDPLGQMDSPNGCSGTLAIGGFSSTSSQTTIVNDQSFRRILWGDVVFNDGWDGCDVYEDPDAFAVAEIATHELGHVLGLGHSQDSAATMAPFVHLDGRGASAATILMDDDKAGLAFIYPHNGPFTLTVAMAGAGTGTVTSNPGGIDCGLDCSEIYTRGTSVTLAAAAANPSFTFVGWTGPADCADGMVTMIADTTCTANFARGPDLIGQLGQLTRTIKTTTEKLTYVITVQNVGDLSVTVNPVVQVYLSANADLDPTEDLLVLTKTVKAKRLIPGGSVTLKGKATVPTPSQGKFLILKVDATNTTAESNDLNNLVIRQILIP
jgi:hypothetical protein